MAKIMKSHGWQSCIFQFKGYGVGTSIIAENPLALAIFYNTMKYENATLREEIYLDSMLDLF